MTRTKVQLVSNIVGNVSGGAIVTGVITATGAVVTGGTTLIGSAITTGTASQPLQVTGGAYVSGSVGVGRTNPISKLEVNGDIGFEYGNSIFAGRSFGPTSEGGNNSWSSGTSKLINVSWNGSHDIVTIFTPGSVSSTPKLTILSNNNIGIGTTNPLSRLTVVGGESRFGGVIETVSAATTYNSAAGALVLEMDVRQATTYTYTIPTGANIGIVSFKNMPAPTGNSSGTTITCILTQNAAGTGNTTATTGIGTNCTVVGYENSAAVAGISTRALVGSGTTLTLSTTGNDRDFVSFFVHYTGGTNTTASSYQVYATKNGGFR